MAKDECLQNEIICTQLACKNGIDSIEELEHIASCDKCAASYAAMIEQNSMVKSPHYMKAAIMEKVQRLEVIQMPKQDLKKREYYKKLQLFRYSMKVGFAMCGALAMLFLFNFNYNTNINSNPLLHYEEQTERSNSVSSLINKMNHEIRVFSNNMVQYADDLVSNNNNDPKEDNNNEKEKK